MCGRVRLSSDVSEIKLVFSIPPHRPTPNFPPSWNMAPTDQLPVVRLPNELCAELHNRMPAVLKPETWPVWLGEELGDASSLKAMLVPFPSDEMTCWPVSTRVGNVKNNDPSLIEPIAA